MVELIFLDLYAPALSFAHDIYLYRPKFFKRLDRFLYWLSTPTCMCMLISFMHGDVQMIYKGKRFAERSIATRHIEYNIYLL